MASNGAHTPWKLSSLQEKDFSTSMESPTTPFTPRLLFPPKGEWSLHTQCNIQSTRINPRENPMQVDSTYSFTHTNIYNIHHMQITWFPQEHYHKFHVPTFMRWDKETWHEALTSFQANGYEMVMMGSSSLASNLPFKPYLSLQLESGWTTNTLTQAP